MGFDENGIAVALQADVIGDVGAYSIYPWTCGLEPVQVVSFLPGPYKIGPIAVPCAASRPTSRRPDLIAASAGRSRLSSPNA